MEWKRKKGKEKQAKLDCFTHLTSFFLKDYTETTEDGEKQTPEKNKGGRPKKMNFERIEILKERIGKLPISSRMTPAAGISMVASVANEFENPDLGTIKAFLAEKFPMENVV